MHKQTKAVDIPPAVKRAVWERDGRCCVLCGSPFAAPNAHVIPRSQGGPPPIHFASLHPSYGLALLISPVSNQEVEEDCSPFWFHTFTVQK